MYTLICYAFYDLRSRNGVGPILTALEPTQGGKCKENLSILHCMENARNRIICTNPKVGKCMQWKIEEKTEKCNE